VSAGGRFDLLHAYQGMPGVAATAAGRRLSLPVVVTIDSGELVAFEDIQYGLQRRWIDRRAIARALRAAARVTVTTEVMKRTAAALVSDVPRRRRADRRGPARVSARGRAGAARRSGVLRVASLNRVKDYPTLLRALGRIVASLPVHLDIVGEDTLDGVTERQAQGLGLEVARSFHGFQPTDALAAFYTRADLHVVSSRHEAAGGVVLEAACAGVPTVGTRVGYLADWSLDGAEDGRERAVAVAVAMPRRSRPATIDLLQDAPRRERIAGAAREWALAHDADWTAQRFEEIYAEVARPSSKRT
jgi:glycosyltransferase involved in cell wall biosynthesis